MGKRKKLAAMATAVTGNPAHVAPSCLIVPAGHCSLEQSSRQFLDGAGAVDGVHIAVLVVGIKEQTDAAVAVPPDIVELCGRPPIGILVLVRSKCPMCVRQHFVHLGGRELPASATFAVAAGRPVTGVVPVGVLRSIRDRLLVSHGLVCL